MTVARKAMAAAAGAAVGGGSCSNAAVPTVGNIGSKSEGAGGITLSLPTGLSADDMLLAFVATDGGEAVTWNGDWTEIGSADDTTDTRMQVAYHFYDGSTSPNLSLADPGDNHLAYVVQVSGVCQSNPFDTGVSETDAGADVNYSISGMTTTDDNMLYVVAVGCDVNEPVQTNYTTVPSGGSGSMARHIHDLTFFGNRSGMSVLSCSVATATTLGSYSYETFLGSNRRHSQLTFALRGA